MHPPGAAADLKEHLVSGLCLVVLVFVFVVVVVVVVVCACVCVWGGGIKGLEKSANDLHQLSACETIPFVSKLARLRAVFGTASPVR